MAAVGPERPADAADAPRAASQPETLLKTGALEKAIFHCANFSSIATDAKGVIHIFNAGAERLLGYAAAEVVGRLTPAAFHDPDELSARAHALSAELGASVEPGFEALAFRASRGVDDVFELTKVRKDGSRFPAQVSVSALRDDDDAIIGYLLVDTDDTERRRAEEERQEVERRLQQKNIELIAASHMKSEFLANMSHELRTPLNAIIGFSEVLRDGLAGELSEQQKGFVGDIFGSGNHLLSLINDILDLSKVEAGKMVIDLEPVSLSHLLDNSLSIIKEKAAASHVLLELDVDEQPGTVLADVRRIKQIMYNLLSNAVKFTGVGGHVTVRAARVPRGEVGRLAGPWEGLVFPLPDGEAPDFLQISVTDDGIGIAEEDLERLFEPFSQIDSGLARKFQGSGLGLALVKVLAELHGGTVAVESAPGEGSRFVVWLPLQRVDEGERTPDDARAGAGGDAAADDGRTALVVEDDFKSAELIRVQLEADGFHVLHAASAEAAMALAVQQPLALIILDILLPNMDGWEFLGRLKQIPDLERIPVVITSIVEDRNRGFSLGAAAVLQKPISRQQLYQALTDIGLFPLASGQSLEVLVVDDDPQAVELTALRISGLASRVLRAHGGREAIEIARRERPDVIVLDLMMPEVSGFEVVAALHESPETVQIPILVVTAREITAEERDTLRHHVMAIMDKADFDGDHLRAEVRRAISGRKAG